MQNAAVAAAEVKALSDPASANYDKWLTSKQFANSYGPEKATVTAVQSWLKGRGFTLGSTLPSGMYVQASGTVAQIEDTFHTKLATYSYMGKTVQTNTTALALPASTPTAVVGTIAGIIGLDQGSLLKKPAETLPGPPAGARYGVQPCSAYFGQKIATTKPSAYGKKQPYAVCGYGSAQLQSAYGEASLLKRGITGKGVTVAITDAYASPTILQDSQKYSVLQRQPLLGHGQFSQITPGPNGYAGTVDCDAGGWYGEETLDVEAVHAMAPGAKIVYVAATDCGSGLDNAWAASIDNHVADIITNSWGYGVDDIADVTQPEVDFYQQFSTEAALTGITVNFSTGDSGDSTKGGTNLAAKTVSFPADLPLVTAVGGTSIEIGSRGQRLAEYGWQNSYAPLDGTSWSALPGTYSSGGTGGTSVLFAQPWYQGGIVPVSVANANGATPMRAVPDISMDADANTGMTVGQTQTFPDGTYYDQYRIGGTSLASPLMAGVLAVAEQAAHRPFGFANPLYYKMSTETGSGIRDIVAPAHPVAQVRTNYTNSVSPAGGLTFLLQTIDVQSSTLHDTRGYDDETGVGTPGPTFFHDIVRLK